MHKIFPRVLLPLILGVLITADGHSQNSEAKEAYNSFDRVIGLENTDLLNGKEYIEQHIIRNQQHKYFGTAQFKSGKVVYDGLPYYNISMKFNVYDDVLFVKIPYSGGERSLELHKEKVQEFVLEEHRFVNLGIEEGAGEGVEGFYEVLMEGSPFQLYKEYTKKRRKFLDADFTYFEFENDEPVYIYEFQNVFQVLGSRRALIQNFPGHRKQIREFYRNNTSLRENSEDDFYTALFQELANMISTSNPIVE